MLISKSFFVLFLIGFCYAKPQYPETIIRPPGHIPTSDNDVNIDVKATEEEPDKLEPPKVDSPPKTEQPEPPVSGPQPPTSKPQPSIPKPQPLVPETQPQKTVVSEQPNNKLDDSELQKVELKSSASEESKPEPAKSEKSYKYNGEICDLWFIV